MAKVVKQKKEYTAKHEFNKKSHYSDYVKLNREYFGSNPSTLADEYNKQQKKKPIKLTKWVVNVLVICSLVIFVVVSGVVCSLFAGGGSGGYVPTPGNKNAHNFSSLCSRPDVPDSTKVEFSPFVDSKEKAAFLYKISSENITKTPYFTAYNKGLTFMKMGNSDNYIDVDAVIMKTQDEYFNIEYHLKNSVPILDSFIGSAIAKTTDVVTTTRKYVGKNDNSMTYQKVKNNAYDENGVPYAVWDSTVPFSTPETKSLPIPIYNASQEGVFEITKHAINENTISDAEVKYDRKGGFYTVSLTLDHTNPETVANSINDIRAGTGDPNTSYSLIKIDFTVWDNGYLRSFDILEKWDAKIVISLNFELETHWQCSYAEKDCDFASYNDVVIMKNSLKPAPKTR